jgi:hypothetical protein
VRRATAALVVLALGASGCAHGGGTTSATNGASQRGRQSEGERGREADNERAAAAAKKKIPAQDRITYYQLADASSVTRRLAGDPRPDLERIRFAVARLRSLHPADRGLDTARLGLIRVLAPLTLAGRSTAVLTDGAAARAAADAAVRELNRYGGRHPAVVGLVPD